jgi:hypothetical protein
MRGIERGPRRSRRVLAAFFIGPLVAAGLIALLVGALAISRAESGAGLVRGVAGIFALALMFEYLCAAVLGGPGYWLFRRLGWSERRHWFLLGGVVGGASGALLSVGLVFVARREWSSPATIIIGSAFTVVAALCMGLVFRWLLPSREREVNEIAARFD